MTKGISIKSVVVGSLAAVLLSGCQAQSVTGSAVLSPIEGYGYTSPSVAQISMNGGLIFNTSGLLRIRSTSGTFSAPTDGVRFKIDRYNSTSFSNLSPAVAARLNEMVGPNACKVGTILAPYTSTLAPYEGSGHVVVVAIKDGSRSFIAVTELDGPLPDTSTIFDGVPAYVYYGEVTSGNLRINGAPFGQYGCEG